MAVRFAELAPLLPVFLSYVLSFVYVGIYWNNHHHMLHDVQQGDGRHSLGESSSALLVVPVSLRHRLDGREPLRRRFLRRSTESVLLAAALAYWVLQQAIISAQGPGSVLERAVGSDWKGKLSPVLYVCAIASTFVLPWIAQAIFIAVAILWLVPDRRIERTLQHDATSGGARVVSRCSFALIPHR